MKRINGEFWRKCQFPLVILFGTLPVVLCTIALEKADWFVLGWAAGGIYALFAIITLFVPAKRRILTALAGCAVLLALGVAGMRLADHWVLLLPSVFYCILLLWGLQMGNWSWSEELPATWHWIGIVIHGIYQILYNINVIESARKGIYVDRNTLDLFVNTRSGVLAAFFCFILLAMLSLNRDCMAAAGMGRQKASVSMQRKNTVLVLVFFGVAIVLALIPAISNGVIAAWSWIARTLGQFINNLVKRLPIEGVVGDGTGGSDQTMMGGFGGEAGQVALVLQKIFIVVGGLLTAAVVGVILYLLARKLWNAILNLMHHLSQYAASVSEDYEDEITDTRDYGEGERIRVSRRNRRAATAEDKNMSPGERVRRRYLRLLYRHPEWSIGSTARENLPAEAAPLYEQARYSNHPLTEADAERFSGEIKRL